jgi:formylglycine-generating enzyme required for sulfatase activity
MGVREVTNGEFRVFLSGHHSGGFKGRDLNRKDLPVVQVTWEQAALFCNWLSAKDSLPPAYTRKGGQMVAVEPMTPGYRLPTEAEWEYCARYQGKGALLKYPWGDRYPPKNSVVNIGDLSAKDILPSFLENYDDGYETAAPPMQYQANPLGIYDMGGNVAEWCHDYYSIYPYKPGKVAVDPMGPREGAHRVVRGASWKDSSISSLRLSYRGYSQASRQDLGFRICRYVNGRQ